MAHSLTWLPRLLLDAGLKVATTPGWENRGHGDMSGSLLGVMCHQTEHPADGNMPSLNVLVHGRRGLAGPLSQLGLARDGTWYVIAAGLCYHAGEGEWGGVTRGNSRYIGIEAENRGGNDRWPPVQMESYVHGVAAILQRIGRGSESCIGHKEWARDRRSNKRFDPGFDMDGFRAGVARVMNGTVPPPRPIPIVEPARGRPTLRRDDTGRFVGELQDRLGVVGPDVFGPKTEAAVRAFQRANDLVPDGIVGPKTWALLDAVPSGAARVPAIPPSPPLGPGPSPADPVVQPTPTPQPADPDGLAWGAKVEASFRSRVRAVSAEIGCNPDYLMACMAFETGGTFRADQKNAAGSGATGLIQFMPSTATALGTSTAELERMTEVEQLDYVAKYFRPYRGRIRSLEDLYMAILCPRAIGKPDDYTLYAEPTKAYTQNRGLDANRDGRISRFEAAAKVRQRLVEGLRPENVG